MHRCWHHGVGSVYMPPFIQKGWIGSVCIIVKWVKLYKKCHQIVHADVLGLRPVYHRTSPLHRGVHPSFFCLWFWWGVHRCTRQSQDISGSCAGGTQQVLIFCLVWQPSRSILITWRWFVKRDTVTHRTYQMLCQSLWQHVHVGDAVNWGWADNLIDYARE